MKRQIQLIAALALLSVFALCLLGVRVQRAESPLFLFLVWNLILAWIPLILGVLIARMSRAALYIIGPVWLLFLPNSAYLVTDLVHLRARNGAPYWLDMAMLASFAVLGLFLGIAGLDVVHRVVERRFNVAAGWVFAFTVSMLSGFGIYLGRFLRWNSWDVATEVGRLSLDLFERVASPDQHPRTWGVTLAFGGLYFVSYVVVRAFRAAPLTRRPASGC